MGTRTLPNGMFSLTEEGLFSIAIARGEIVQEKPSLNLGELFKSPSPIAVERMTIDSPAAFDIASHYAAANVEISLP